MKKQLLLTRMLLLVALLVGSTSVWGETYTIGWGTATGTAGTFTNFTATSGTVTDIVSFSSEKNSSGSNPAYNANNSELRLYYHSGGDGCSVTLTPAAGVTITGAVMTTSTEPSVEYSVDGGAATAVAVSDNTYTVTGISAKSSLTFQNVNTSNTQLRIKTIQITYTKIEVPTHTATFSVNGETTVESYKEGKDIEFPSNPSTIAGKVFKGWSSEAIDGTTDTAPTFVTEATMGTSDVTYYAVFASEVTAEGNVSLTINKSTKNFPGSYGTANTFEKCNLEGVNFQIQQAYVNGTKLQWRASGNSNGTGTMYNDDALNKIQSIVLNYDGDDNKNFTVKVGDNKNPTSGTEITPSTSGNVYTFDCSTYNKSYFVMTNGTGAGYLSSIVINYIGEATITKQYCTTIPATVPVTITDAKYATFASYFDLDFSGVDGLYAYTATVAGDKVTFTKVTGSTAAGEGLLLYSETAKTYNVPVATDSPEKVSENKLVRGTGAAVASTDDGGATYNYVLSTNNKGEVNFYRAAGKEVGTNKAYLKNIPTTTSSKFFLPTGEDETDGIKSVQGSRFTVNGEAYNLSGQRVGKDYKGIVIVNGKKVIRK